MQEFLSKAQAILGEHLHTAFPMSQCTTFKIGGPAQIFAEPQNKEALVSLFLLCKEKNVPFTIIGAGSNLLVSDNGIDGVVCRLSGEFDCVSVSGTTVSAGAAISLAKLSKAAQREGLSGLEFASGIPGTLGGAVYMNAGAYDGEMKDVVMETEYMDESGEIHTISGDAHDFSYRHSVFSGKNDVILSVKMNLTPKDKDEIFEKMRDLNARRKEKQPLDKPSAGSTFKRPEGFFAAKLIEDAGLKGFSVGDACVSEKHAGFVVNNGNATCKDVLDLMRAVQKEVKEKFGVILEPEVKYIGK